MTKVDVLKHVKCKRQRDLEKEIQQNPGVLARLETARFPRSWSISTKGSSKRSICAFAKGHDWNRLCSNASFNDQRDDSRDESCDESRDESGVTRPTRLGQMAPIPSASANKALATCMAARPGPRGFRRWHVGCKNVRVVKCFYKCISTCIVRHVDQALERLLIFEHVFFPCSANMARSVNYCCLDSLVMGHEIVQRFLEGEFWCYALKILRLIYTITHCLLRRNTFECAKMFQKW